MFYRWQISRKYRIAGKTSFFKLFLIHPLSELSFVQEETFQRKTKVRERKRKRTVETCRENKVEHKKEQKKQSIKEWGEGERERARE